MKPRVVHLCVREDERERTRKSESGRRWSEFVRANFPEVKSPREGGDEKRKRLGNIRRPVGGGEKFREMEKFGREVMNIDK